MIAPDWLRAHPDLASKEDMPAAAVAQATRGWGKSDRPEPLVQYQEDPVGFAVEVLGIPEHTIRWSLNPGYEGHRWDGTPDAIAEMLEAVARGENVGVESGTGTGKSFALAIVTLWFLGCWEDARVYTYAPQEKQLRLYMWAEIREMWPAFKRKFPTAELTDLRIRMYGSDKWSAHGFPVQVRAGEESATAAQGAHAPHMLLITEETPGIEGSVMKALDNTATGGHNLQLSVGNPDHQEDELHKWCIKHYVTHVRASALDFPNVVADDEHIIPGAVTRGKVERRRDDYGSEGRLFLSRVRGISPAEAADALIRRSWLERAAERYVDARLHEELRAKGEPALGVDVANSEEGDKAAIAEWQGCVLEAVESFQCPDALKLAYKVQTRQALIGAADEHVGLDSVGVGVATVNKGKELEHRWTALNGGLTGSGLSKLDRDLIESRGVIVMDEAEYLNLRSQIWWLMRTDLQRDRVAIPPEKEEPQLWRDLLTPTWTTRNGRIVVESKEEMFKRLGRSPDEGDATVYGNAVRERRLPKVEEPPKSAWDPEVLEHESKENRRVREKPAARTRIPPTAVEHIP